MSQAPIVEGDRIDLRYFPQFFDKDTLHEATSVIIGDVPSINLTPTERWHLETNWLAPYLQFSDGLVVDYGCGIGRLAKLIQQPVLGVDISPKMRAHACEHVQRDNFGVVSPEMFSVLCARGLTANGALAVWALQHIPEPIPVIDLIAETLNKGAKFVVVNNADERLVPAILLSSHHFLFVDDKKSDHVDARLALHFDLQTETMFPPHLVGERRDYLRIYERR